MHLNFGLWFAAPDGHALPGNGLPANREREQGLQRQVRVGAALHGPAASLSHMLCMCCRATGSGLPSNRERGPTTRRENRSIIETLERHWFKPNVEGQDTGSLRGCGCR